MRGRDFVFDLVTIKHFKSLRVTFKCGGSYIGSPAWLKNWKGTTSPQNGDNKCFQYAATIALNYQGIETHPERVLNIAPFI